MLVTNFTITRSILDRVADLAGRSVATKLTLGTGNARELLGAQARKRFVRAYSDPARRESCNREPSLQPQLERFSRSLEGLFDGLSNGSQSRRPLLATILEWAQRLGGTGAVAPGTEEARPGLRGRASTPIEWIRVRTALVVPPPADQIEQSMESLDRWLLHFGDGRASTVLGAGVLLHNLLQMRPLTSHNELVAHLASLQQLARSDMACCGLLTLDSMWRDAQRAYKIFDEGTWSGDLTRWLELFVEALESEAAAVESSARELMEFSGENRAAERKGFNDRQVQALTLVRESGRLTNRDYRKLFRVSNKTAHQELRTLVDRKLIKRVGFGRSVEYVRVVDID
jgi:Fic family protein